MSFFSHVTLNLECFFKRGEANGYCSFINCEANVQQQASVKVMDKVMDQSEIQSDGMIKMMEQSVSPHLGSKIDFKA
ncbi:YjfB family protein [Paraliobacillus quinghaiensis]|uniref:YjfB family protein n=1 Tax=Paraliobacillus quinghaiensis TaxID=470815 RepID=UPI00357102E1